MIVDLDWPLNASSLLSASAELLVSTDFSFACCPVMPVSCLVMLNSITIRTISTPDKAYKKKKERIACQRGEYCSSWLLPFICMLRLTCRLFRDAVMLGYILGTWLFTLVCMSIMGRCLYIIAFTWQEVMVMCHHFIVNCLVLRKCGTYQPNVDNTANILSQLDVDL